MWLRLYLVSYINWAIALTLALDHSLNNASITVIIRSKLSNYKCAGK